MDFDPKPNARVAVVKDVLFNRGERDEVKYFSSYEVPHRGQPPNRLEVVEACDRVKRAYPEYQIKNPIEGGAYGATFILCQTILGSGKVCDMVMKTQKISPAFYNEVEIMYELQGDLRFCQIIDSFTCEGEGIILMERLEKCDWNLERRSVLKLLEGLYSRGFLHMDNHSGNVMCRRSSDAFGRRVLRPVLIDFGIALSLEDPNKHSLLWHDNKRQRNGTSKSKKWQGGNMRLPRLDEGPGGDWRFWAWSYQCMILNEDSSFEGEFVSKVKGGPYKGEGFENLDPETPGPEELAIIYFILNFKGEDLETELNRLKGMIDPKYMLSQNIVFFDTHQKNSSAPFDWRRIMFEWRKGGKYDISLPF